MADGVKGGGGKDDKDAKDAGAPGTGTGMSKPDMKKLLLRAQREPVNCALAQGSSGGGNLGLLLLDKTRPSKALAADLKKQFPDARKASFGTVSIDPKGVPKVTVFSVNKPMSGMDRKLRKTLAGTGFKKVELEKSAGDADGEE